MKQLIKGLLKGATLDVFKFLGDLKNLKFKNAQQTLLDINGDGKINFDDVKAMQWEHIGKLIGFILLTMLLANQDVIMKLIFG